MSVKSDFLDFERHLDYTPLKNRLASGNWQEADEETYLVMLEAIGREEGAIIRDEDWKNFDCDILKNIDRLWVKYSYGKFGLSIQKSIFSSLEGTTKYDEAMWLKFGQQVGWYLNGKWQVYERLNFSAEAPAGCFPVLAICGRAYGIVSPGFWAVRNIAAVSRRLTDCHI